MNIEIKYNFKQDSRPAPKYFMKYYEGFSRTASFENPGKGTIPTIDREPADSEADGFGNYYVSNYKKDDTTLTIGFSINF